MFTPHDGDQDKDPADQRHARITGGDGELLGPAIDRVGLILEREKKKFERQLCKAAPDMDSIVESYVGHLFSLIRSKIPQDFASDSEDLEARVKREISKLGADVYEGVSREVLGPLVVRFAECVLLHAPQGSTVAFLARDAEPYFAAAKVLNQRPEIACKKLDLRYVTLNRGHLEIPDENLEKGGAQLHDSAQRALRDEYLAQEGFGNPQGVVVVDTGCWGTMIEKLMLEAQRRGFDQLNIRQVFFMYSYNPHIFGFVNEAAKASGYDQLVTGGVFIGDTFECLPKGEQSSNVFSREKDGILYPVPRHIESDYLSAWQRAVVRGVTASARDFLRSAERFPSTSQALSTFEEKKREAKNSFTGVLPQATPPWTGGEHFLKT